MKKPTLNSIFLQKIDVFTQKVLSTQCTNTKINYLNIFIFYLLDETVTFKFHTVITFRKIDRLINN